MVNLKVGNSPLTLASLRRAWLEPVSVDIDDAARDRVKASNARICEVLAGGKEVYGVNTGFGLLANVHVSDDELAHLQDNLVRSHAVGIGAPLPDEVVRLVMLMKLQALAQGYSGVRPLLVDAIAALLEQRHLPGHSPARDPWAPQATSRRSRTCPVRCSASATCA